MAEQLHPLDARLATVEHALAEIEARLQVLERGSALQPLAELATATTSVPQTQASETDFAGTFTLIGRTFVILAGAYLLRALTEAGTIDRRTGAMLGLAYAAAWTVVAYRVAPRYPHSASFFGASTVLIGFPLLLEATTRFALFGPEAGALALAATTGLVLVTAWRRHLHALAWIGTIAGCVFASLLLVMTGVAVPFVVFLIALGLATLWLGYDRDWTMLRWIPAFFADLAVLGLAVRALATPPRDDPVHVMLVQLLLLVGYLGSIVIRTIVRGRTVLPFEAVQTGAMLVASLAGAILIVHQTGSGALAIGPALLALSAACYAVVFVDPRQAHGANLYFYTSLALVFALTGAVHVLDSPSLGIGWASLAVLAGWAGHRDGRRTLALHSLVYLTAAAVSGGLLETARVGLFSSVNAPWGAVAPTAWVVLFATALCWLLSTPMPGRGASGRIDGLRLMLALLAVVSIAGICVVSIGSMLPSGAAATLQAGMVATVRTGVIAVGAVVLAWLGRHPATREFGLLFYPVLGWGALKLLFEDLPTSPPSLLVVAFVLYGGALILGPRIARVRPRADAGPVPLRQDSDMHSRDGRRSA